MKAAQVKNIADSAAVTAGGVSALVSKVAPFVSVTAGLLAIVWTSIRIYEWLRARRVPKVHEE